MENLTFDQLPKAVEEILGKVNNIEKTLQAQNKKNALEEDVIFNLQEACDFLRLKKPTIYGKVQRNEIPYFKWGKHLYFSKKDLIEWIKKGRRKTKAEITEEVNNSFGYKPKNG